MQYKLFFVIFLTFVLSACATKYQAAEDGVVGYRDLQIDKTTYYVEYTASKWAKWEEVHDLAIRRCVEIAKENGFDVFDVISKQEQTVFLETDVDQITVSSMGLIASDAPVANTYAVGGTVEGRRVTYKIKLIRE